MVSSNEQSIILGIMNVTHTRRNNGFYECCVVYLTHEFVFIDTGAMLYWLS